MNTQLIVNVNYTVITNGEETDKGLFFTDKAPFKTKKASMERMLSILPELAPKNWYEVSDDANFTSSIVKLAPNKAIVFLTLDANNYVELYVEVVNPNKEKASPANFWVQAKQNNWTKELTINFKLTMDRCFQIDNNYGAIMDSDRGKEIYEQAVNYIETEYVVSAEEQAHYDKICAELEIS